MISLLLLYLLSSEACTGSFRITLYFPSQPESFSLGTENLKSGRPIAKTEIDQHTKYE